MNNIKVMFDTWEEGSSRSGIICDVSWFEVRVKEGAAVLHYRAVDPSGNPAKSKVDLFTNYSVMPVENVAQETCVFSVTSKGNAGA